MLERRWARQIATAVMTRVRRSASKRNSQEFSRLLRERIVASGMTQAELGRKLGRTSQTTISHWANGERIPNPYQVFALERALGVPPGGLSRALGYVPADSQPTVGVEHAVENDPKLTPEQRRGLLAVYRVWTRRPGG